MASSTSIGASTSADGIGSGGATSGSGAGATAAGSGAASSGAAGVGFTGVGDAGSTIPPGVVPPMDATGILQALATLIRQQPVGEMRSTKALQSVVRKLGRFDGREVSHYLREYRGELVLAKISDTEAVANFELVVEPELRDRVREIARRFIVVLGGWELFERAMKEEFLEEDTERITRRTFLDWVERRPGLTMGLNELFREFDRRYGQLPFRERLTLETRRTELFLRAADDMSADRLCFMLADRAAEGGISSEWARVQEAVSILTRQRRAMGHYAIHDVQQRYGVPHGAQPLPVTTGHIPQTYGFAPVSVPFPVPAVPAVPVQMPVAQMPPPMVLPQVPAPVPMVPPMGVPQAPAGGPNGNQVQQNAIDDLTRQLRDLRVEMAGLRRGPAFAADGRPRNFGPRQCIWCDSPDHLRAECGELAAAVREGIVHYRDGRLHLTTSGQPLATRFGRGGMRTLIPAPVGGAAAAVAVGDQHRIADVLAGHLDYSGVACPVTHEDAYRGRETPRSMEELRRGAQAFRRTTGWEDPVDLASVQAYLNTGKHVHWADDAIVEEKRRRDATDLDTGVPEGVAHRVLRRRAGELESGTPSTSRAPPPAPGPMEGVQKSAEKPTGRRATPQEKGKSPAYKLKSDIESAIDIRSIFENQILNAKFEFTLRDLLGIAKRELHDLLIDVVKRKRQAVSEDPTSQAIGTADEDFGLGEVFSSEVADYESEFEHVALVAPSAADIDDLEEDEMLNHTPDSHFTESHWARATTQTKVKLEGLAEPIMALVDHGSEINIITREVWERGQWPIEKDHGWALRSANNERSQMYGACPNVRVKIGDVEVDQHFFVHSTASFPVILGQPYITAVRMETKVMNDGSHFARIRSLDERGCGSEGSADLIPSEHLVEYEGSLKVVQKTGGLHSIQSLCDGLVSVFGDGWSCFQSLEKMCKAEKKKVKTLTAELNASGVLEKGEQISGVFEEVVGEHTVWDWFEEVSEQLLENSEEFIVIPVHSRAVYEEISSILRYLPHPRLVCGSSLVECWCGLQQEAEVHAKYKVVAKKVKPMAVQLPPDSQQQVQRVTNEPILRNPQRVGHKFTRETLEQLQIGGGEFLNSAEKRVFEAMIQRHGRAFSFVAEEIGCADPAVVAPMIIFTVPHVPWDMRPIPVPRAMLPKVIELLKEKVRMGILEPSMAPYSSRWFTVPKKSGALRFIQDLQPANSVTIRNLGMGPIVDEVADAFAGRAIYSIGDLYSGYDQFQLALESRDLTTIRTPLGLMRMCTLPQGATNSVAHMQNAMHKVLRDFVPEVTIPFVDDIPIMGCVVEEKDDSITAEGCRKFVSDHIRDVERILTRLEEVHLTLSGAKSRFGVSEILVVGHLCGAFGRRPNPEKVDALARMKDCQSVSEVRRFLGSCVFYRMSVPHYAHLADPLYALLRKGVRFVWREEQSLAMKRLKEVLKSSHCLRPLNYNCGRPIIVTVDTSPKAVGWAVGQDDAEGVRFVTRFGARILTQTQRDYPQVKRELWGVLTALKVDKDFLIGAYVVLETDCLPLLGMIANCNTPDITMLRWIAYIRSMNPELRHIAGKKNVVADMLSRARYADEEEMLTTAEDEELRDTWCQAGEHDVDIGVLPFREELYSGRLRDIGLYLSTLERRESWSDADFKEIRKKAYGYLLKYGYLWKRPKRTDGAVVRVVDDGETKQKLLAEFHDTLWAGHRGVWATYMKIKERYWWRGLYRDVESFVRSCLHCQFYSKVRYRDGLVPTFPPSIHFRWVLDLVMMPPGLWGLKYLVLAREDLSNYVEGRALRSKSTESICRFVLEDIFCRYGSIDSLRADRGDLDSGEARAFFQRYGVKLKLTSAYNPEGIGKSERGHPPIVHALVKACNGQKPIMPVEEDVPTWASIPWEDNLDRDSLLALRIRQLERREEDLLDAREKLKTARLKNKARFDKTHRLRPKPIQVGDWVLVYDSSLENQHSTVRKFSRRWFGPYVVLAVYDNATYSLRELDGTPLRIQVAGKRVKLFRRREGSEGLEDFLEPSEGDADDFSEAEDAAAED
ncbi:hypothetical protein R1sor_025423 [Riccia sorocarpa]|uniref:RNA-directed DNA polymerase n=1 Tax=Riccia sorocarpa TaxID=122646 RepID=A0ABD3GBU5_9MARC